jgi:hypothetical protein
MNTAQKVIKKFGGQSALAKLIGKGQSTVQHWSKKGIIPAKWQRELLLLARNHNIDLTPSDFVSTPEMLANQVPHIPIARWQGVLTIGNEELPCYVLDDGRRVISRTGATSLLTERKGGGNLEQYIRVQTLQPYLSPDISERMIKFVIPEVVNKTVRGLSADDFLEICKAYVRARDEAVLKTDSQISIAIKASMFLSACSKIGLIALIDEATGYQYDREQDALEVKLKLYLEEEMREWEKTFPDELWMEFGRLTHWQGSLHSRPKYWGKLVLELIYEYLESDVIDWLRKNKPPVRYGGHWHSYYSENYGLKRLIQHIWMVIGIAKTCFGMYELREKMAIQFGREPVQLTFFMPPPAQLMSPK